MILFLTATNVYADQVYINKDFTLNRNLNIEADDKFVWQGTLTKTDYNNPLALQDTVAIPLSLKEALDKNGTLETGKSIQISGVSANGIRIAKEIKLVSLSYIETDNNGLNDLLSTIKNLLIKRF